MNNIHQHELLAICTASDVVRARTVVSWLADRIGFNSADQTRLATAVSELARNVLVYATEGICEMYGDSDAMEMRLRVVVEDHGPGIADIDAAMKDGYSTGTGLGAGLPGTRRLVDEFNIESEPGHTRITIAMVRKAK